jgi:probable F420-dependent oxidoreductase
VKLGLFGINFGACADRETAVGVARAAEAAGFESVWTGEHVVLPDPRVAPSPSHPQTPFLDPAVALTWVAAHTTRLRLATGIVILPQRNPVVLAKEMASVDVVSNGRLVFGVGVGYLRPEFEAIGADFERRGARMDEHLDAILALWTQEKPSFRGETVRFAGIDAQPRPVQKPHPPIVIGATTPPAWRRAVARANGWYGFAMAPDAAATQIAGLAEAAKRVARRDALGRLHLTVTPPPGVPDRDTVKRYEDLGVERLVLLPTARGADELIAFVERAAEAFR